MSKVYPALLKRLTICLKRSEKVFLKFIYQISKEFWIRNTLFLKYLQTDMIFFDQFRVAMIIFRNCFAEFMIPIALLLKGDWQLRMNNKAYEHKDKINEPAAGIDGDTN